MVTHPETRTRAVLILALALLVPRRTGCSPTSAVEGRPAAQGLEIQAPAFRAGGEIPTKFTCQGDDISPALTWTEPPAGTRSFVLIMDDPDAPAGTWVHWVVYDLPANQRGLHEAVPKDDHLREGGTQGRNDFEKIGYGGPCPPPGKPHRYFFKLYALDAWLRLPPGATKREVERAMEGHILARGQLIGRYRR